MVTIPAVLILIIAAIFSSFMDSVIVAHAFNGIRACVTALILASVIKLFKGSVKDWPTRIIYIVVLALAAAGNFMAAPERLSRVWEFITSPVFLVIISGVSGLAIRSVQRSMKGGKEE